MAEKTTKLETDDSIIESSEDTALASEEVPEESPYVELQPGNALDSTDCLSITTDKPTELIVFAGSEASGKTTLLSSIYESFNEAPFADFLFAGSKTLVGFEKICHLNRLSSGENQPDTDRTIPSEQVTYYHLSLFDRDVSSTLRRREVLFAAESGELFRLGKNSTDDCKALTFVKRADVLGILIDGAKLANPSFRQVARADAVSILRSLLDADMLSPKTRVEFLFSKLDCIKRAGTQAESFLETSKEYLLHAFLQRVPGLRCREIAARPTQGTLKFAFGIENALRDWLFASVRTIDWEESAKEIGDTKREFAAVGSRYFPSNGEQR